MSPKKPLYMLCGALVLAGIFALASPSAATQHEPIKDGGGVSADETVQAQINRLPSFTFDSDKGADKHDNTAITAPINLAWIEGTPEQIADFMESECGLAPEAAALARSLRPGTS